MGREPTATGEDLVGSRFPALQSLEGHPRDVPGVPRSVVPQPRRPASHRNGTGLPRIVQIRRRIAQLDVSAPPHPSPMGHPWGPGCLCVCAARFRRVAKSLFPWNPGGPSIGCAGILPGDPSRIRSRPVPRFLPIHEAADKHDSHSGRWARTPNTCGSEAWCVDRHTSTPCPRSTSALSDARQVARHRAPWPQTPRHFGARFPFPVRARQRETGFEGACLGDGLLSPATAADRVHAPRTPTLMHGRRRRHVRPT